MSTIYIREQGQLVPLDIPEYKGDRGEPGVTPDLQVGSITVLPSDQQASVAIQGDKENPTINFGIPSGEIGDKGLYIGRPEDAYDETKIVFDDKNWVDDTYFENSTVDYMGGEHKSLKEKSDSDVEYILRKFGTQHYEGSSITATNTYAMQVKSAMFKGNTLVNLVSEYNRKNGIVQATINGVFEKGKKYIIRVYNNPFTLKVRRVIVKGAEYIYSNFAENVPYFHNTDRLYNQVYIELQKNDGGVPSANELSDIKILVLEYQEGMEKQDIPYFEGMKSVKNPTLTVTNADSTRSHTLATPSNLELRSNGNVYDELDLVTGKLTQRIGEDGSVLTQPIVKTIDLQNQKIYSYDGTTHYITSSLQGHPNPILSIDVPTNITSLLKHQQNTINQQRLILSEREEMQNILIESMLYRYEQSTLLNDTIEVVPDYIQKLYEVAYQRGIRFRKEE